MGIYSGMYLEPRIRSCTDCCRLHDSNNSAAKSMKVQLFGLSGIPIALIQIP